jgi:hypothetical protein
VAPPESALPGQASHIAPDRDLGNAAEAGDEIMDRRDAGLVEKGKNPRFAFSFDH